MSDTSQGPGWWLAADGRWYPPDTRPRSTTLVRPSGAARPGGPGWWQAADGRWYPPSLHPGVLGATAGTAGGPLAAARRRRRARPWVLLALVLVAAGTGAALLAGGAATTHPHPAPRAAAAPPARPWLLSSLQVVGGPVAADGRVLVVTLGSDGTLSLTSVDPAAGSVVWQLPYSTSAAGPGVPVAPLASHGVALDLAPAAGAAADTVRVQGVDVRTGTRLWAEPAAVPVLDAPQLCTASDLFCVDAAGAAGPALVSLAPATGTVIGSVAGPTRRLAPDLYVTGDNPPMLVQLSRRGPPAWRAPLAGFFGLGFAPQYGARFTTTRMLDVGSVGVAPSGDTSRLDTLRTVAVRIGDGTAAWQTAGAFECLGTLPLSAPFVCRYGGSGVYSGPGLSTAGVPLTLQGIDLTNGAVRWAHDLADAHGMTDGTGVPVADATHVVVPVAGRGPMLLDLGSGRLRAVRATDRFWCSRHQQVPGQGPGAATAARGAAAAPLYSPCTASGSAVPEAGLRPLPGIGVTVGGLFVWASPDGLAAQPVR